MAPSPNQEDDGAYPIQYLVHNRGMSVPEQGSGDQLVQLLLLPMLQIITCHTEWRRLLLLLLFRNVLLDPPLRCGIICCVVSMVVDVVAVRMVVRLSRLVVVGMIGFTHFLTHPHAY